MTSESAVLSEDQHLELSRPSQSRSLPAGYVFRAKLILMLAEGAEYSFIKQRLGTTAPTISGWKQRFLSAGLDGLDTFHPAVGVDCQAAGADSCRHAQAEGVA